MSGVMGGEGGEGRGTAGKHQVINKKGIHRRQANEADKTCAYEANEVNTTCAYVVWGHEANTKSW